MNGSTNAMVTLSHQYGSGGSLIARELGRRLHWPVWDKELVHSIATRYQLAEEDVDDKDERTDTFIDRLVRVMGLGGFEMAYGVLPPRWLTDTELVRMTREMIEEIAATGNAIIVGRGGNHILTERPVTLHVFILAPLEERVHTVMQVDALAHADAKRRITGMDRLRADYVQNFYHADWQDPSRYHLSVDSSLWGVAGSADLIQWALVKLPQMRGVVAETSFPALH